MAYKLIALIKAYFPTVSLSFYDQAFWYVSTIDEGVKFEYQLTKQVPTIVDWYIFCTEAYHKIYKIMIISFNSKLRNNLYSFLNNLELKQISIHKSGEFFIELTSKAAKKSRGIAYIMKKENLAKNNLAAFGDSYNDIAMLESVGTPIVMDNAPEEIKSYARYVTGSNDDNGVGYGIWNYLKHEHQ